MNRLLIRCTEFLMVTMLSMMIVLVFGNVVLRYVFNSGLVFSEEASRFLFMWLTLLGALLVMHDRGHLGMTMLVARLSTPGRRICRFLADAGALACCLMMADGVWRLISIVVDERAPVTGISMAIVYTALLISAVGMAILLAASLWRQLTGRMTDDELIPVENTAGE